MFALQLRGGLQWELVLHIVPFQLFPIDGPCHVDMLLESIIHKCIRLGDIKGRVSGVHCITYQGKLLAGKGEGVGGRNKS